MRNVKRVAELEKRYPIVIQQPFGYSGNYCVYYKYPSHKTLLLTVPVLNYEAEEDIKQALAEGRYEEK